jgi:hypothetical protein
VRKLALHCLATLLRLEIKIGEVSYGRKLVVPTERGL